MHIILHRNLYFEYIFYEVVNLDNFNIDKNTMDKLNSMLKNGNLNDMISQIPPDAIKNFSNMMQSNTNSTESTSQTHNDSKNTEKSDNLNSSANSNTFDFSNIDINTMMKIKSVMEKMNHSSDPRSNLLQSLKPYLRDEKKSKLDQYSKLLDMTTLMELFNQNNNKENTSDK